MKNLFLYISAFIPMYLLILVEVVIDVINDNLRLNILNSLNLILLIILTVLGIIGVIWSIVYNHDEPIEIQIISKTNITDQHFLGYFSLFVLFSLSFDLSKISMFVVFILILIMIGMVYIKNDLYYINPFLNILGMIASFKKPLTVKLLLVWTPILPNSLSIFWFENSSSTI